MTCGIYAITNLKNNRFYIGQSISIEKRIKYHITKLSQEDHYNEELQNDWNKFDIEDFSWTILEIIENPENLNNRERFHIMKQKGNVYNANKQKVDQIMEKLYNNKLP